MVKQGGIDGKLESLKFVKKRSFIEFDWEAIYES